jgi:hypothetical protein
MGSELGYEMNALVGVLAAIWCLGGLVGYYTAKEASQRRCAANRWREQPDPGWISLDFS